MDEPVRPWDPSSPEARAKFERELIDKGWVWNDRLEGLVPPGMTEEQVEQRLIHAHKLAEKHKKIRAQVNAFTWIFVGCFVLAIFYAPWLWMVLTLAMVLLGFITRWGGGKGGDDFPGGAGTLGPF